MPRIGRGNDYIPNIRINQGKVETEGYLYSCLIQVETPSRIPPNPSRRQTEAETERGERERGRRERKKNQGEILGWAKSSFLAHITIFFHKRDNLFFLTRTRLIFSVSTILVRVELLHPT